MLFLVSRRTAACNARTCVALTLSLLIAGASLTACGGGGGGSSPASPPAAQSPPPETTPPTLTVTAGAVTVSAGGSAIPLSAAVQGTTGVPTWTLDGPGTLSAPSGTDVQFKPPDTEDLDTAATATITARVGASLAQQIQIAVTPVPGAGQHWSVVRRAGPVWPRALAHGNGEFILLDQAESIWRSPDGLSWTAQSFPTPNNGLYDLAWGDAGWVAVGSSTLTGARSNTATSPDGVNWTFHEGVFPNGNVFGIIFGNHIYVAYSPLGTRVSTDGVQWTEVPQGFQDMAFGNGQFIGLAPDTANGYDTVPHASIDGTHWYPVTNPHGLGSIAFRKTDFAANAGPLLSVTGNGSTWISASDPVLPGGQLTYAGNALFDITTSLVVTPDGQPPQQVAGFDVLSQPSAIAANAGRYVAMSGMGWLSTSTDATHWTTALEGSVGNLTAVDHFNGSFVAVSDLGWLLRSADAQTWARHPLVSHPYLGAPAFSPRALAHGGGVMVAVGQADIYSSLGMWMRTTDGVTWVAASTPAPSTWVNCVTHDGRRFVAADRSGSVYASEDGDAWQLLGNVPGQPALTSIAHGNGVYVAVGSGGVIAVSTDASNWTLAPAIPSRTAFAVTMLAVTWDGARFVAVGNYFSAASADGHTWTRGEMSLPASTVAAGGGRFIAAAPGQLMSSSDGLHWRTRIWSNTSSSGANAVTFAQGRFVAVGPNSLISSSDH